MKTLFVLIVLMFSATAWTLEFDWARGACQSINWKQIAPPLDDMRSNSKFQSYVQAWDATLTDVGIYHGKSNCQDINSKAAFDSFVKNDVKNCEDKCRFNMKDFGINNQNSFCKNRCQELGAIFKNYSSGYKAGHDDCAKGLRAKVDESQRNYAQGYLGAQGDCKNKNAIKAVGNEIRQGAAP